MRMNRISKAVGVTCALWLAWLMLAWSVPAVAQYTPPPGCGTPCKVTVLQIKSGTTLTIKDASGNAGPVFTDAGTTIDVTFDGTLSLPGVAGSLAFASGETIVPADGTLNTTGTVRGSTGLSSSGGDVEIPTFGKGIIDGNSTRAIIFNSGAIILANSTTVDPGKTLTIGSGTAMVRLLKTDSASIDLGGAITANCTAETNVSITGVAAGDSCTVNTPAALATTDWIECRTLTDNVALKYCTQGAAVNPAAMVYSITTIEY